jgi:hypothetical protein
MVLKFLINAADQLHVVSDEKNCLKFSYINVFNHY